MITFICKAVKGRHIRTVISICEGIKMYVLYIMENTHTHTHSKEANTVVWGQSTRSRFLRLPVNELVWDDKVPGPDVLPQGAARCGHQDVGAAACLEGPQVSPVVHLGGHDGVPAPMSAGMGGMVGTFQGGNTEENQ